MAILGFLAIFASFWRFLGVLGQTATKKTSKWSRFFADQGPGELVTVLKGERWESGCCIGWGGGTKTSFFETLLVCPAIFAVFPPTPVQVSKATRLGAKVGTRVLYGRGEQSKTSFLGLC